MCLAELLPGSTDLFPIRLAKFPITLQREFSAKDLIGLGFLLAERDSGGKFEEIPV
jgi:hypothetical protein